MLNDIKKSPNFGWHYRMHTKILNKAAEISNFKAENPHAFAILQNAVPEKRIKSFLDFSGKHNAKYLYLRHLSKFFEELKNKNCITGFDEAGRALHYLQDITQPQHIESGSIIRKALDKSMHHRFEVQAFGNCDKYINNHTPYAFVKTHDFLSLFNQTVKISRKNKIPSNKNTSDWDNIAQSGVNLAIDATKRFLEIFYEQIM